MYEERILNHIIIVSFEMGVKGRVLLMAHNLTRRWLALEVGKELL